MADYPGRRPKLPPLQTLTRRASKAESSNSAPPPSSGSRSSTLFSNPWRMSSIKPAAPAARTSYDGVSAATHSDSEPPRRPQKLSRRRLSRSSKDSAASSIKSDEIPTSAPWSGNVVLRGGPLVTTTSTKVLKSRKAEYLVLTPKLLVKFDDVESAQASMNDDRTHLSAASSSHGPSGTGKRLEIPLGNIVSVFREEGSTPNFGIEVWYASTAPHAVSRSLLRLFFGHPKERDEWISEISRASRACSKDYRHGEGVLIPDNVGMRIKDWVTEHELEDQLHDLDIYPVVKRANSAAATAKSSTDDYLTSSAYLAIGLHLAFLFEVRKTVDTVDPKLLDMTAVQFGVASLVRFRATMSPREERFVLRFRVPFGEESRLELSSRFYRDIIARFMKADRYLKPAWPQHLLAHTFDIKGLSSQLQLPQGEDMGGLKRTLAAYCAAYGVDPPAWDVNWRSKFAPQLRMMPLDPARKHMWRGQLMAFFRALRYNDYFKSLNFKDVDMSCLWGKKDTESEDSIVDVSRTGIAVDSDHITALKSWSFLAREIHALIFSSGSVRSIDLTNCLQDRASVTDKDSVEILHPIMYIHREYQCLCESIYVGGNPLSKDDVNELVDTLMTPHVRIKDLDISRCKLQADALEAIWHALGYQGSSLVTLDVSQNMGHVDHGTVSQPLEHFTNLRRLSMSNIGVRAGNTGSLTFAAIWQWPLEELNLSSVALDETAVQALCQYLESPASHGLKILYLEKTGLPGNDLARLFRSMGQGREMVVYANGGSDEKKDGEFRGLADAIANNYGPTALYLDRWEFAHEENYMRLMRALAHTSTVRLFSATGTLIPKEMSDKGGRAIVEFLARNQSVRYLDLSGYDCKLETSRFGRHFAAAMKGLRYNHTLLHLRVRDQMLGRNVSALATAVADNTTLRTLDIPGSGFRLSEFTFLTKALERNHTLRRVMLFSDDADREQAVLTSCGPPPLPQGGGSSSIRKRALRPLSLTRSAAQADATAVKTYDQRRTHLEGEWMANRARILENVERNRCGAEELREAGGSCSYAQAQDDTIDESYLSDIFGGLAAEGRLQMTRRWLSEQGRARVSLDLASEVRPLEVRKSSAASDRGNGKMQGEPGQEAEQPSFILSAQYSRQGAATPSMIPLVEETEAPPIPARSPRRQRPLLHGSSGGVDPLRSLHRADLAPSPGETTSSSRVPTPPELDEEHNYYGDTGDEYSPDNPRTPAEGSIPLSSGKPLDLLRHRFWKGSLEDLKEAQSVAAA